jgi:uncharacterized protein YutE (UPF0331/DUF86 family)
MVDRDFVLDKVATVDRCLARIAEVHGADPRRGLLPVDVEDLVVLNLQRATQSTIDLAMHVAATEGYGLPGDLAEGFTLLEKHGVIDADLAGRMRRMVGFRNIAVHQYEVLDPQVVEAIVSKHLGELRRFAARVVEHFGVTAGRAGPDA